MNEEENPIIDIEAKVIPLVTSIAHPIRALATLKGREGVFEPAENLEMRGRRPSGIVMPAKYVPAGYMEPVIKAPEYAITKRSAKGVAEELTGLPVTAREKGGRCYLEVAFPWQRLEFAATTWFLAAASLKAHLDKIKYVKPQV